MLGRCLSTVRKSFQLYKLRFSKVLLLGVGILVKSFCLFERDQREQFEKKIFQKSYLGVKILCRCLLTIERFFQLHKLRFSFTQASKYSDFFFCSRVTNKVYIQFSIISLFRVHSTMVHQLSKTYFVVQILGRCLPTIKKYFQLYKLRSFLISP